MHTSPMHTYSAVLIFKRGIMMEENNFTVYCHLFPNNKQYFGITKQLPEKRWKNGLGYKESSFVRSAINKYGWNNIRHIIVAEHLTKDEACLAEQTFISLFNTDNRLFGYNSTSGGEYTELNEEARKKISKANLGKKLSAEHREKLSKANLGKKLSAETKRKMSESRKGRTVSEETRAKCRDRMLGTHLSAETREKIAEKHRKKVIMCDLEDNELMLFNSQREAAKYLGINYTTNISGCLYGRAKTCYGYKWKFGGDYKFEFKK